PATSAEPPVDVGTQQIDDQAGVVADTSAAQDALDELRSSEHVGLYVVLVNSFGGLKPTDWAQQSFNQSGLGGSDVLLAIAIDEGRWSGYVNDAFPLSRDAVGTTITNTAQSHMHGSDWPGTVVAAAQGLQEAVANGGAV